MPVVEFIYEWFSLSLFIHFQNKLLYPTFLCIAGIRIFETFTVQVQEKSSYREKTFQKQ